MHPLEGGELDVLRTTPGPASTDHLGFVEADDGFGQSVIVRVASAADGRLNARLGEPLGVTGRDVEMRARTNDEIMQAWCRQTGDQSSSGRAGE